MISPALAAAVHCHQALAHPVRLRILAVLRDGKLCVGELQALLGLAFSTVSRHVSELEQVGLVEQHKEGRWVWCRLATEPATAGILDCVWQRLGADAVLEHDRREAQRLRAARRGSACGVPAGGCGEGFAPAGEQAAAVLEEAE